ncbi:MAG: LamG domain-containing protein [Akkermansiaceae bacterium]|nr:LamG domain-containing protein [Akkermansiaceae bacterium]
MGQRDSGGRGGSTRKGCEGCRGRNGKLDVVLSSPRSLVDGRWHQVAASWDPSAVDLFVDGNRVARNDDFRIPQDGTFTGANVRFGRQTTGMDGRPPFLFTGWVDELALCNRPLTAEEVLCQFRAAQGKPPE